MAPNCTSAPEAWQTYAAQVSAAMELFLLGEIDLIACFDLLPTRPDVVREDVHEFIENSISEIDNEETDYRLLLSKLKAGASQREIVAFMNLPP